MEIIKKLQEYINDQNIDYIEELVDILIDEKIDNLDDLKKYEKELNYVNETNSYDMAFSTYLNEIDNNPYEYEGLLYNEIQSLKQERKQMNTDIFEDKALHLVKYFKMTNRCNPFPYMTYQFIIGNKL